MLFFLKDIKYRYGFEADNTRVYAEWLYSDKDDNEICLFDRDAENNCHYINEQEFKEGLYLNTPDNHLFIWQCEQNNGEISKNIMHWFNYFNLIDSLENAAYFYVALNKIKNTQAKAELLKLVKAAGLGIEKLAIEEQDVTQDFINNAPFSDDIKQKILHDGSLTSIELKTRHKKFNADNQPIGFVLFDMNESESQGTKKFLALAALVLDTLEQGKVLLVDQLDVSLHPLLIECFIQLFNNKTLNKHNAQLIFVAHNTHLLSVPELFERDQIWFTQKDQYGSTELYSLLEFKKNNTDKTPDNLENHYLRGRYGAVPRFGS
jgi:AAA15 family ATPase/GTPase